MVRGRVEDGLQSEPAAFIRLGLRQFDAKFRGVSCSALFGGEGTVGDAVPWSSRRAITFTVS